MSKTDRHTHTHTHTSNMAPPPPKKKRQSEYFTEYVFFEPKRIQLGIKIHLDLISVPKRKTSRNRNIHYVS